MVGNWHSSGWSPSSLATDPVFWAVMSWLLESLKHYANGRSLYPGVQLLLVTCRNRGKEGMKGKYLVIQHLFVVYHPYGIDRRKNKDLVSIFCKFKLLEIKKMGPCVILFLVYFKIAPMISFLGYGGLRDGNGSRDKNVGDTILDCDALFLKRKGLKHMIKKRPKKKGPGDSHGHR